MSCPHTWAVVERSRTSEAGDVVTLEACADCPTWRAVLRFSPARDRADVDLTVDRLVSSLERQLAPREPHAMNGPDCTCPNDDYHQRVHGAVSQ